MDPSAPTMLDVWSNSHQYTLRKKADDMCLPSSIHIHAYEGERYKELMHGEGVAYFQGGHVYKGMFSEGLMHGQGIYTWASGATYEGEFVSNIPMGHGKYTWLDGSTYQGDIYNAIRHGNGTHKNAQNSVVYRGQWHAGKRHGKGVIYYNQDASSWYEGDWLKNKREGWGLRRYPSGSVYEGEWENNVRHGSGTMRWLTLGQQYTGAWHDGVQHGQGTHTWFLKRAPGSQYPQANKYSGDFVMGARHGQGTFHYASGALYQGGWKNNKKHGQAKFIFKNGRVFEGEFVDDHMADFPSFCLDGSKTPNLSGIRSRTPCGVVPQRPLGLANNSMLGPDMILDLGSLLDQVPESQIDTALKQVGFVVFRRLAELKSIYSFYSSLGHSRSQDNTFLLSHLQYWRLLKDCKVHHHGKDLAQLDRLVTSDVPPEEIHSPFTAILLHRFLSSVVAVAYHTYHKDMESSKNILAACFSRLMEDNILPNAKNVKGFLFNNPLHVGVGVNYLDRCWDIFQSLSALSQQHSTDWTMTLRQLVQFVTDLGLLDTVLTTRRLLEIVTAENADSGDLTYCNLDVEITFLEFFEVLLGCCMFKCTVAENSSQQSQPSPEVERGSQPAQSPLGTPGLPSQSDVPITVSPKVSSTKSTEREKSVDVWNSSSLEDMEAPQKALTADTEGGDPDFPQDEPVAGASDVGPALEADSNPSPLFSAEPTKEIGAQASGEEPEESELDMWTQGMDQFFNQLFSAYEHSVQLKAEVREERVRQEAQSLIALAKVQELARRREEWKAETRRQEEVRRQKAEEEAEKMEGHDEGDSPPPLSPVASNSSLTAKHSAASKKKKRP